MVSGTSRWTLKKREWPLELWPWKVRAKIKRELDVGINSRSLSNSRFVRKWISSLKDQTFLSDKKSKENTFACFPKALSNFNVT